jgi:phospholipid transport system substrate-binding protein
MSLATATFAGPAPAADAGSMRAFIDTLGGQVLGIIKSGPGYDERQKKFRELFQANFDVPAMGKFTLGRHWQRASADEQAKYLELLKDYVAAIYAQQFARYEGQAFRTVGVRPIADDEGMVEAEIVRQGQPPIRLGFRVRGEVGTYRINDVTVEEFSLVVTKRGEFASLLAQDGIPGVMKAMQQALEKMRG